MVERVNKGIARLQELASNAFSRTLAKTQFNRYVKRKKQWFVKGHGWEEKRKLFKEWYKKLDVQTGCVYAFWDRNNRCLYVGRTGAGGTRPSNHFDKFWFKDSKRITIYEVAGRSHIPKIECLAIHHNQPHYNKNTPATKKWTKACPLCKIHKSIEQELRQFFQLR